MRYAYHHHYLECHSVLRPHSANVLVLALLLCRKISLHIMVAKENDFMVMAVLGPAGA